MIVISIKKPAECFSLGDVNSRSPVSQPEIITSRIFVDRTAPPSKDISKYLTLRRTITDKNILIAIL